LLGDGAYINKDLVVPHRKTRRNFVSTGSLKRQTTAD